MSCTTCDCKIDVSKEIDLKNYYYCSTCYTYWCHKCGEKEFNICDYHDKTCNSCLNCQMICDFCDEMKCCRQGCRSHCPVASCQDCNNIAFPCENHNKTCTYCLTCQNTCEYCDEFTCCYNFCNSCNIVSCYECTGFKSANSCKDCENV